MGSDPALARDRRPVHRLEVHGTPRLELPVDGVPGDAGVHELGLTNPALKTFALGYATDHKK